MSKKLVTINFVGFEVLIVMVMKSCLLWGITPSSQPMFWRNIFVVEE